MSLVASKPRFGPEDAVRVARERFGIDGGAQELDGERDQNFRIATPDGTCFILKFANPVETAESLAFQHRVLEHLAATSPGDGFPRVVRATDGADVVDVEDAQGRAHHARLLAWIAGQPLAAVRPHSVELLRELGALLGRIDRALATLAVDAGGPPPHWDLRDAMATIAGAHEHAGAPDRRSILESLLARAAREVEPVLAGLPIALIHGDANDYNVLVRVGAARRPTIAGLIDFGDMGRTLRAAEPAVAAAYAALGKRDPLAATAAIVRGYCEELPLEEQELDALYELVLLRLGVSVSIATRQRRDAPENGYLAVTEGPAWSSLPALLDVHPRFARAVLRDAAGLAPLSRSVRVQRWLGTRASELAPVVPVDVTRFTIIDLGGAGVALGDPSTANVETWTRRIFDRMRDANAEVGIGRYDEARLCYATDAYATGGDAPERRTVHLGVDLFLPAGTDVLAPLDGVVHAVADNDAPLDYGPTVVLRHDPPDGPSFFTLFGHLDPEVLERLAPGVEIARGARVARVGAPPKNGGWPPHLHLQIVVDVLDFDGDFPGVAPPSRRDVWLAFSPDPRWLVPSLPLEARAPRPPTAAELVARRERFLGSSLSLHYDAPLHIVAGSGAYLYDENGQSYLDCVNNVCHVGHAHPRVVAAATTQMAALNTNTRYLHERLVEYAERLAGLFPDPLGVCFFVCTGSEANELALRMARAHTKRRDVIALEAAYHGNTQGLIDVSGYKHDGRGGEGAPPHVHKVPLPDVYRGIHRDDDGDPGALYARHVVDTVERLVRAGRPPAAFLAESIMSCAGQIVLPRGYLARAYEAVRAAGGVCIADEVQTGLGRIGTHLWAFEAQGVVPDVVTVGKPIGNGHPLALVITTNAIARSFANGMEYFNTFGGNPVSCAAGLAVLDVIEDERLQEHAAEVGGRLKRRLEGLMPRHPIIGDVRGLGLFLGVDLVCDRQTREPATAHAKYVIERARELGVLLNTDGPGENVLKIKPPLPFSAADADRLADVLDRVLGETAVTGAGSGGSNPCRVTFTPRIG